MTPLLLHAGICVTQDEERRVISDAAIVVSSGVILEVGPWAEIAPRHPNAAEKDLSGMLVMPGLINAHTHASMSIFRGAADDLPLMEWLTKHIWPAERHLTAEIVHLGAILAFAEMLRTGTTCMCDMYLLEDAVARAVDEAGMRAVLGEGIFAFPSPAYDSTEKAWPLIDALHETWDGHPRIRTAIMPHALYTTSAEILKRSGSVAAAHASELKRSVVWKTHLAESESETRTVLGHCGKRPVEYLDSLGLLTQHSVFAHGVDFTGEEMERLAEAGCSIVHCPTSNMKLASGSARIKALMSAGVNVCLGTDGAASNNTLNMFAEMNHAALLQKVSTMDPTALPAQTVLDMATVNAAAALHWPQLGSLAPGKAADIIALDLLCPNLLPLHNPVSHLVYAASGHEVRFSMVAGRILYEDGGYTSIDYPGLIRHVQGIAEWVQKHAS